MFLDTSSTPGISPCSICEALKALVRGQIISHTSYVSKQHKSRLLNLLTSSKLTNSMQLLLIQNYIGNGSPYRLNLTCSPLARQFNYYTNLGKYILNLATNLVISSSSTKTTVHTQFNPPNQIPPSKPFSPIPLILITV